MVNITINGSSFGYNGSLILHGLDHVIADSKSVGAVRSQWFGQNHSLKCIDMIFKPKGSILLDGKNMEAMSKTEMTKCLGYIHQSSSTHLATTFFDMVERQGLIDQRIVAQVLVLPQGP